MTGRPLPPAWEDDDPMTPDDLARADADAAQDAHYGPDPDPWAWTAPVGVPFGGPDTYRKD